MLASAVDRRARRRVAVLSIVALAAMGLGIQAHAADSDPSANEPKTATPIKHVIVVIGENRSFDHLCPENA
jgi:phospholipase C